MLSVAIYTLRKQVRIYAALDYLENGVLSSSGEERFGIWCSLNSEIYAYIMALNCRKRLDKCFTVLSKGTFNVPL